ncbi:MAG: rhodanese-like domain-containing protein [Sphingobacteriia bacterium]|nr:rhodanese-like domain-containing protein [Sphingobacteriia bacterium]NCC40129.1 rhodanese-like domain-containing protein [Gammaproteobacteria bacterium]
MINEIDSESLQQRVASGEDLLLVDIRTPAEIAQGAIPEALRLPMHMIPLRMSELPKDRDLVLYCRSGARSYQACAYLMQQGYDRVINLRGGIIAWARHGYPIV